MRSSFPASSPSGMCLRWLATLAVGVSCPVLAAAPPRTSICTPVGNWYGVVDNTGYGVVLLVEQSRSGAVEFDPAGGHECVEEVRIADTATGFSFDAARTPTDPRCQGFHGHIQYDEGCESGIGHIVHGDGTGGRMTWRRDPHLRVYRQGLTRYSISRSVYSDLDHISYSATRIAGAVGPRLEKAEEPAPHEDVLLLRLVPHPARDVPQPGGLAQLRFQLDTVDGPVVEDTKRAASFGMSCYVLALEADYGTPPLSCQSRRIRGVVYEGAERDPFGLPGQYCRSFIANVRLQGSAQLTDGSFVHYEHYPPRIFRVAEPPTADGTPLVAGSTVARDPKVVRGRNVAMVLDDIGAVLANDRGGSIKGYRIDLYGGAGEAACRGYTNPTVIGACATPQDACPGV